MGFGACMDSMHIVVHAPALNGQAQSTDLGDFVWGNNEVGLFNSNYIAYREKCRQKPPVIKLGSKVCTE